MVKRTKESPGAPRAGNRISRSIRRGLGKDGHLEAIHKYQIDIPQFTIYLGADAPREDDSEGSFGITYKVADCFEKNLDNLSSKDPRRPILIKITNYGGYFEEGHQIIAAMNRCPNPITAEASKTIASMAGLVALAADRFYMIPPAKFMLHHGYCDFDGSLDLVQTNFIELEKAKELHLQLFVARLKEQGKFRDRSEEDVRAMLLHEMRQKRDVWLDAYEAQEWGICDQGRDRATKRNETRRVGIREVLNMEITVKIEVVAKKRG